ncbi:hypothetical protein OG21DRAFT_1489264 [Imleria badia]|nr:hypothetical protein OG21DRAFT_1489264 [Imleria badia]
MGGFGRALSELEPGVWSLKSHSFLLPLPAPACPAAPARLIPAPQAGPPFHQPPPCTHALNHSLAISHCTPTPSGHLASCSRCQPPTPDLSLPPH